MSRLLVRVRVAILLLSATAATAATPATAGEISFLEKFSLAPNRAVPLKTLIPGTENYFFFNCLHLQNQKRYAEVDAVMKQWLEKTKSPTGLYRQIESRQVLLRYGQQPMQAMAFLRNRLKPSLNHQQKNPAAQAQLPTTLDPRLISRARLTGRNLKPNSSLNGFQNSALHWLSTRKLTIAQRRSLLSRLTRPDLAGLPRLVVDDLAAAGSRGFGSLNIHRLLLLEQLDECLEFQPGLLNQTNLVNTYLSKLQPGHDTDWKNDPAAEAEYLDRLWAFARQLDPVHNSLKAHVLARRLRLDHKQGVHNRPRFLEYIKLPRNMSYVRPQVLKQLANRRHLANLQANYTAATALPIVGNDEPLLRIYLEHFFKKENSYEPFEAYLLDTYLKQIFAETKILAGQGDPARWAALLTPEQYTRLQKRVDIDFITTNSTSFAPDDNVTLDLEVKNVETLLVKIFELNTLNYYRDQVREVNTDVNLDGLVPNFERTLKYAEPPQRKVLRKFAFPELKGRGTWVIDFIGNGKSSRVLVRKGKLRHLVRTGPAGHIFSILDETGTRIADASIWLGGQQYSAQKNGTIQVPFSTSPGPQPLILVHDGFASFDRFSHESENYSFAAGILVDRESLLERRKAQVVIRPSLSVNGTPVSVSVLEDVRLRITSTNRDGIASTREVGEIELADTAESVHLFQVPPRLSRIDFNLTARIKNISQGKDVSLATAQSFVVNVIDQAAKVDDIHLLRVPRGYVLESRGKSGEPRPGQAMQVVLTHRDFRNPVTLAMQTAANGRVSLGPLAQITSISATAANGTRHAWQLGGDRFNYPQSLHGLAGEVLRIPWMEPAAEATREEVSLLEIRGGRYVADRFDAVSIRNGFLEFTGLPAGDYHLLIKPSSTSLHIRLTDGARRGGYLMGRARRLEDRSYRPLQVVATTLGDKTLSIQLANAGAGARVHVFATRYVPAFSAHGFLGRVHDAEPFQVSVPPHPSLYIAGRNIGDEFRYIIDRKYQKQFAGNMLSRPSLLLNPWPIRKTTTGKQQAAKGESFGMSADAKAAGAKRAAPKSAKPQPPPTDYANLDFLADSSLVRLNLKPNKQGLIELPREALGNHNLLHIVAVDLRHTATRSVVLPDQEANFLDLRLARGLDPKRHFTQQGQTTFVPAGKTLVIQDITSSRFEIYDSLGKIYGLYRTLSNNSTLAEFRFVLDWPTLDAATKRQKYSKYACHELNFFLAKKDPEFFGNIVQPFLRNKKDKTFMDHWLLGNNLDRFLDPWSHARLNIVERILLAERLEGELIRTRRHVDDLLALRPRNTNRVELLFETALGSRLLESEEDGRASLGVEVEHYFSRLGRDKNANGVLAANPRFSRAFGGGGRAAEEKAENKPGAPSPKLSAKSLALKGQAQLADRKLDAVEALSERLRRQPASKKSKQMLENRSSRDRSEANFDMFLDKQRSADAALRQNVKQLFRRLDHTQEWVENHYYRLPIEQMKGELVVVNRFWNDYAQHNPADPFFSEHFAEAAHSFPEMMFALSVLDLPFDAAEHKLNIKGNALTLAAGSPAVVLHREIKPAGDILKQTPVLVTQNFFRLDDRYQQVDGEKIDKFVADEFLLHTVYGCQVVLTNPSSAHQRLNVLLQVPVGAIPVAKTRYTHTALVALKAYSTERIEYFFYFPAAGDYPHYPVHVARDEQVIAAAEPVVLKAVATPSKLDLASWAHVSQNGTRGEVLEFLRKHNILALDLSQIAFRVRDREFFSELLTVLRDRRVYNHTLWAYGLLHNDVVAIREYLRHIDAFVNSCGSVLNSPLLVIDPVERRTYQHMDYRPLVNARRHQLGQQRQILNDRFHAQYHRLLKNISYRTTLSDSDRMAVTYYLLLQERVEEALTFFVDVQPNNLQTRLQYDYFTAYLDLFSDKPQVARAVSEKWLARLEPLAAGDLIPVNAGPDGARVGYPVDHWRQLFGEVVAHLDEAEGRKAAADPENDAARQKKLAASQPNFDITVESKQVTIDYQNLKSITLNYYLMDIELLFSRNPFVKQDASRFAHIRPNQSVDVALPAGKDRHKVELPRRFHNRNVLVEVRGQGLVRSQAYYSNSLAVQVVEPYGQVRVTDATSRKPAARVYVKVYARGKDGRVSFYKDGYTDLRGRFDYASLSTNDLDNVARFSMLVLSSDQGAIVKEAAPPKR
jgi:hypothetical protein